MSLSGSRDTNSGDPTTLAAMDQRLQTLHTAATAMRNRLVAVQEYVDSTQVC